MKDILLSKLNAVDVAAYDIYKEPSIKDGDLQNTSSDETRFEVGCIAQQLHSVFPHLVVVPEDSENGIWHVDYTMLVPLLLLGYKDLNQKVSSLESQISELKEQL